MLTLCRAYMLLYFLSGLVEILVKVASTSRLLRQWTPALGLLFTKCHLYSARFRIRVFYTFVTVLRLDGTFPSALYWFLSWLHGPSSRTDNTVDVVLGTIEQSYTMNSLFCRKFRHDQKISARSSYTSYLPTGLFATSPKLKKKNYRTTKNHFIDVSRVRHKVRTLSVFPKLLLLRFSSSYDNWLAYAR